MDPRHLQFYKDELEYLREAAAEFAKEYPKIAPRLDLRNTEVPDPYVERLLEGFAFVAARVQMELGAQFPRFTAGMLENLMPGYLAPVPSMGVVQIEPDHRDPALAEGVVIPRHSLIRSELGRGDMTPCTFRTAHETRLWPVKVAEASYVGSPRDLETYGLPQRSDVRAAIRLQLSCTGQQPFGKLGSDGCPLDKLPFFLQGAEDVPLLLFEELLACPVAVFVRPLDRPEDVLELPPTCLQPIGFSGEEALLPQGDRGFEGHRLLLEYFVFPERFRGVEVGDLGPAMQRAGAARDLEIFVLLGRRTDALENLVDAARFALFCTPVINLFEKRCDRIHVDDRALSYHVVPDRTRPRDFEVHTVTSVVGHKTGDSEAQDFRPLFGTGDTAVPGFDSCYYTLERRQRIESSTARQDERSTYTGSEVFLSVVDTENAPYDEDLMQLGVTALCSNRDLALTSLHRSASYELSADGPVVSVQFLVGPSRPRPSIAVGESGWQLIDHLSLNHVSLMSSDPANGASTLRRLVALHADLQEPHVKKQADGIRELACESVVRRLPTPGPLSFGRGLGISLTLEERFFEGGSCFLFGCVLERFFSRYVSLNSFTETSLSVVERGHIAKWPPRIGSRQLL